MMQRINNALQELKIPYWITGGTLLGAVRHSGVIPWDDDLDICIMHDRLPALKHRASQRVFRKHGLQFNDLWGTERDPEEGNQKRLTFTFTEYPENDLGMPFCDIFIMKKSKGRITYADVMWETADNGGKTCDYNPEHVFPLRPYLFGNFLVLGPRLPVEHLNRCYGNDWNHKAAFEENHETATWSRRKPHEMKPPEFEPSPIPDDTGNETKVGRHATALPRKRSGARRGSRSSESLVVYS